MTYIRCALLLVFTIGVVGMSAAQNLARESNASDEDILKELNAKYVESFMKSEVEWYRRHLADDFVCVESDGSVLDKSQFLTDAANPPGVLEYHLDSVRIRIFGDAALVHGDGSYTRKDHTTGKSRYTDTYIKMNGEWKVVSAQITRVSK